MTHAVAVREHRSAARHPIVRWVAALSGAIAPLLFFAILIVAGLIRPGYNPIRQYGSELESGSHAWLVHTDFLLTGLLEMAFAYGLHRGIGQGCRSRGAALGPLLMGVAGFGMVLVGIFSGGSMHVRAVKVHSYGLMASYVLIAPRLAQDRRWHRYALLSVAAAAAACIPWAALNWVHSPHLIAPVAGLVQRLHYAILFGWIEALSLRLLHLTADDHPIRASTLTRT